MKCQLMMWREQDQTHTWFLHERSTTAPSTFLHSCGSFLLLYSLFVQQQKFLHVPGTKESYKSHPQCQGWLSESPLTAHTCVCPATNTCLLTLMTRNLVSPGDGGEYTNKMLQVLWLPQQAESHTPDLRPEMWVTSSKGNHAWPQGIQAPQGRIPLNQTELFKNSMLTPS